MRYFLVKILSIFFKSLSLPAEFPSGELRKLTFVTLDNSIVLDAILFALAKKAGFKGIADCHTSVLERTNTLLYRTNLNDEKNLLRLSKDSDENLFITVNIIHGIGPIRTTRNYSINILDALSLLAGKRFLVVIIGEASPLPASAINPHLKLSRALKVDFYKNLKIIRGTPFQSLKIQAQQILAGKDYLTECQKIANDLSISRSEVEQRCRQAFFEMSSNPVRWVYLLIASIAKLIVWHLFTQIKVEGINNFTKAAKEHPVVLVPMHRSHLDYIILGAVLYKSRLNTPLVAAGINLNFWPVGYFLRRVGAFFVKRTGGSDQVHTLVLKRYIHYLLKRGHLLEFFIEGGRSRTGRMRAPKLGLLKTIVNSYQKGIRKDLIFMPISISYEQVIEERALADENVGSQKIEENIKSLFSARSIFKKKYGEVIIKFGEPLSIANFIETTPKGRGTVVTSMARTLSEEMRARTNPTFTSLVCSSLLMAPRYALDYDTLSRSVRNLAQLISIYRKIDNRIGEPTETLTALLDNKKSMSEKLVSTGLVQSRTLFGKEVFSIPEQKRMTADFYKNATMHLFLPFSFLAISELITGKIEMRTVEQLHDAFEHDFMLSPWQDFSLLINSILKELKKDEEVLSDKDDNLHFKAREVGSFVPALMLSPIQSYLWVIYHLSQLHSKQLESAPARVNYDDFIDTLTSNHTSALDIELLTRTESFSRSSMESTIEALSSRGIISTTTLRGSSRSIRIIDPNGLDRSFFYNANEQIIEFLYSSVRKYRAIINDSGDRSKL